jgi:hypothetical protein
MSELSDKEWQKKAEKILGRIHALIALEDDDMVVEIFSCLMADLIDEKSTEDGIPFMLEFVGDVLNKAYGVNPEIMRLGMMQ